MSNHSELQRVTGEHISSAATCVLPLEPIPALPIALILLHSCFLFFNFQSRRTKEARKTFAKAGGSKVSAKKAVASRANGTKGGRTCKKTDLVHA